MRALILLTALVAAGCASQPTDSSTGKLATTDAQRVAMAKNLNLKIVDQDGQQVFCRSNYITASRIRHDTTCYTVDELDKLEAAQQRDLDYLSLRSSMGGIRTP
jgi:hypothetical protein